MRILIFSRFFNNPLKGGAELALFQVFSTLAKKHEVHIVCSRLSKEKKYEKLNNIRIHRVSSTSSFAYILKGSLFATFLHKKKHFDVLYVLMANQAAFTAKLFLMCNGKIPSIINLQSGDSDKYIKNHVPWYAWYFYTKIYTWFDHIIAISSFLKKRALRFGANSEKVSIIPNGVDLSLFKPLQIKAKPKTIITTSRLAHKNNLENLILSLDYLPGYQLLIVGSGELEARLKNLARGKKVRFLGHVAHEKLPPLLCSASVFVRVPFSEGFGNSFIEAMACKLPVVASKIGGITDFIVDGKNGLLANPENPEDIAKKVLLLENKILCSRLSKAAYEVAKRYSWNSITKKIEGILYEAKN